MCVLRLKTSWLKWHPDYEQASHSFDKAALCYRTAKAYDKAKDAYSCAADSYYRSHAIFHSAKALEQAANICREMKELEEAADFLERASAKYHESGHGDTAGQVLTKAAKLVETVNPVLSARFYLLTSELHEVEDKFREAGNSVRAAANMYARARDFDQLLETLQRLKTLYWQVNLHRRLCEVVSIEVLAHLHNDDGIAATETLSSAGSIPGFGDSDEAPLLERLVDACRDRDEDAITLCCDNALFRSMDNEIAKLARDLKRKLTGYEGATTPTLVRPLLGSPSKNTSPGQPGPPPPQSSLADMKAELLGGASQQSRKKQHVSESDEDAVTPVEGGGVPGVEDGAGEGGEGDDPYGGMLR